MFPFSPGTILGRFGTLEIMGQAGAFPAIYSNGAKGHLAGHLAGTDFFNTRTWRDKLWRGAERVPNCAPMLLHTCLHSVSQHQYTFSERSPLRRCAISFFRMPPFLPEKKSITRTCRPTFVDCCDTAVGKAHLQQLGPEETGPAKHIHRIERDDSAQAGGGGGLLLRVMTILILPPPGGGGGAWRLVPSGTAGCARWFGCSGGNTHFVLSRDGGKTSVGLRSLCSQVLLSRGRLGPEECSEISHCGCSVPARVLDEVCLRFLATPTCCAPRPLSRSPSLLPRNSAYPLNGIIDMARAGRTGSQARSEERDAPHRGVPLHVEGSSNHL